MAESPVATSWSQASHTEFSRTQSQLTSYPFAGKHGSSQRGFGSHFLALVPVLKSCPVMASARQGALLFSLTEKKCSHDLTEGSRVCLSIRGQFNESLEGLGNW